MMNEEKILVKNGISVSKSIIDRLGIDTNPVRNISRPRKNRWKKEFIREVSDYCIPYDCMQTGKYGNPKRINPKIVSMLYKILNGKSKLDTITKDEYDSMEYILRCLVSEWILS